MHDRRKTIDIIQVHLQYLHVIRRNRDRYRGKRSQLYADLLLSNVKRQSSTMKRDTRDKLSY